MLAFDFLLYFFKLAVDLVFELVFLLVFLTTLFDIVFFFLATTVLVGFCWAIAMDAPAFESTKTTSNRYIYFLNMNAKVPKGYVNKKRKYKLLHLFIIRNYQYFSILHSVG